MTLFFLNFFYFIPIPDLVGTLLFCEGRRDGQRMEKKKTTASQVPQKAILEKFWVETW